MLIAILNCFHIASAGMREYKFTPKKRLITDEQGLDSSLFAQANSSAIDYKNAAQLFKTGQYTEAIAIFSRIISNPRIDANAKNKALIGRAQSFLVIDQPSLAISDLAKVKYNTSEKKLIGNQELILGVAYIQIKQYQRAIKHLTQAIKLLPKEESAYANRSVAYQAVKNYKAAAQDLERSLRINPTPSSMYNLAVLEKERKNYARCFDLLLEIERRQSAAYANVFLQRGLCAKQLNQSDQALKDFLKAASLDANNAEAIANIGYIVSSKGDKQTALKYLEKASTLYLEQGNIEEFEKVNNVMMKINN